MLASVISAPWLAKGEFVGVGETKVAPGVSPGVGETKVAPGVSGVGETKVAPGVSPGVGEMRVVPGVAVGVGEISAPVVGESVGDGETRGVAPGVSVGDGEARGVARGVSKGVGDGDRSAPVVGVGVNGGSPVVAGSVGPGVVERELASDRGRGSWGFWTSGTGTKKNAIAANAKLDTPKAAGAAFLAIGSSGLAYRRETGTNGTDISGKV